MSEQLYAALLPVAEADSRYVSDWIVVTLEHALATYDPDAPPYRPEDGDPLDHRLTVRIPPTLLSALEVVAGRDAAGIARWIRGVLERTIKQRKL